MKKVLFVCLGNICRSPIAQGILEHKSTINNLNIIVDSAGISSYHVGEAPDKRMQEKGLDYNIDISKQKARQFTVKDFDEFDFIFAMDHHNYNDIIGLSRNDLDREKVKLFLNYSYPDENMDVPDPYYGGPEGFEKVYQLLDIACDIFIKELTL